MVERSWLEYNRGMTARKLRPEKLTMTDDVMRILQSEGFICAEVVIGTDGKGLIRFAPDDEYEPVETAVDDLTDDERRQLAADIRSKAGIEKAPEVDYGGCPAIGVAGMHSEAFGEENGRCDWCGLVQRGTGQVEDPTLTEPSKMLRSARVGSDGKVAYDPPGPTPWRVGEAQRMFDEHSSECRCTCCSLLGKGKTKGVTKNGDG